MSLGRVTSPPPPSLTSNSNQRKNNVTFIFLLEPVALCVVKLPCTHCTALNA